MHFLTERLSFLNFFFHPYPKSGHCASFWIYALFVYIDSKRSRIAQKENSHRPVLSQLAERVSLLRGGGEVEYNKRSTQSSQY